MTMTANQALCQLIDEKRKALGVRRKLNDRFLKTFLRFDSREYSSADSFSHHVLEPLTFAVARGMITEEQAFEVLLHYSKV